MFDEKMDAVYLMPTKEGGCMSIGKRRNPRPKAVRFSCGCMPQAPTGWIKEALGFRRFSLRGLAKVRGEWDLVCLALNVKRMRGLQAA